MESGKVICQECRAKATLSALPKLVAEEMNYLALKGKVSLHGNSWQERR